LSKRRIACWASRRAAAGDGVRDERFRAEPLRAEPLRAEALRDEAFRVDPLRLAVLRLREEALLAWGTKAPFLSPVGCGGVSLSHSADRGQGQVVST
jgi:hypothetical protein